MGFGDRIKYLRQKNGKTLDEIAQIVGVSNATVSRWENGLIENVRMDKIYPLAEALHTSVGYLMGAINDADEYSPLGLSFDQAFLEKERDKLAIEVAEANLLITARQICGVVDGVSGEELRSVWTPERIDTITNFIVRNADMLKASMPKAEMNC